MYSFLRFFSFIIACITIFAVDSCSSKKDFIITDAYVNKERGGPADVDPELAKKDKAYFAAKLGVKPSELSNARLYNNVKQIEGRRFSSGSGAIATLLYDVVYNKKIAGSPIDIMADKRLELFKASESLREGDLVFFRMSSKEVVTHAGVYLKNGRFISSEGNKATIYNLTKSPWKNNFISGGRLKP